MNRIIIFVLATFLTSGCTKVSEYVADFIPGFKEEEPAQKVAQSLCPSDKPTVQVVEGTCEGDWSFSYHSESKVYTCSLIYKTPIKCPAGSISIGQPSACNGQVDQHTKDKITSSNSCKLKFKGGVPASYRLVCCA